MGDLLSFLSQEELADIKTDVREAILNHVSVMYGVPFTKPIVFIYRKLLSTNPDMSSGVVSPTFEDTKINGYGAVSVGYQAAINDDLMRKADEFIMFDPTQLTSSPGTDDTVLLMVSYYGKVTLTQGSAAVSGADTLFVLNGVQGGDYLVDCVSGTPVQIASVESEESLTLLDAWPTTTLYDVEFEIYRSYIVVDHRVDPISSLIRLGLRRAGG